MVGSACRCIWWDDRREVHVVYLEEWWWEVHVGVSSGMVGGRYVWCIWRNDGGKRTSLFLVGRWVGGTCGVHVSGRMVMGTPFGCIWFEGGWEVHVVYLEEWWWEVHVGVFGGMIGGRCMWCIWRNGGGKYMSVLLVKWWVGGTCGVSGGTMVGSACRCVWWEGGWEANVGV